ncbi:MAG: hypothetical protein U0790_25490 [Isosphaeraceae bacterium]
MKDNRLRAPSTDGALLAVPSLAEASAQFPRTSERLAGWDHDFQGRRADRLRRMVRSEVTAAARQFLSSHGLDVPEVPAPTAEGPLPPLVVTGHQPELFHPGVWVKNFATAALAREHRGLGLNLIVDNDLPKASSIRVPLLADHQLRTVRVEFDQWRGEAPYEDLVVHEEAAFASFADRVRSVLGPAIKDPILNDFWPRAVAAAGTTSILGHRLAVARRGLEASWGFRNLEIPLSLLCETEGFHWFLCHILAQLPRFQEIHNRALAEYRAHYGIRSKHHPVAALGRQGAWREAPFWIWRKGQPRRRALLIRQLSRTMELRIAGEDEPLMELPLASDREACCAVDRLRELPGKSVRLRTRALTTTMFCRYLLGDLFIHGIGGAKYDELGDAISRSFFGIEPPGFLTLSMTVRLGLPDRDASTGSLARIERELRDLIYNPDRHLAEPLNEEVRTRIREKQREIQSNPLTRSQRVARFRNIRAINGALLPYVQGPLDQLQRQREQQVEDLAWNRMAHLREFAFVLHSEHRMKGIMSVFQ